MQNKLSYSVEKGFRFLKNRKSTYYFFTVQVQIDKKYIASTNYSFQIINKNKQIIYTKNFSLDVLNEKILTNDSHEDPLIKNKDNYFLWFEIDSSKINNFNNNNHCVLKKENIIIFEQEIDNLLNIYQQHSTNTNSFIQGDQIFTKKDCNFTLHLGDSNSNYFEKELKLHKNQSFDFSFYIKKYQYIGLQCSYENDFPETEEKYILVGQKGIYLSGYFSIDNINIYSPIISETKYLPVYDPKLFTKIDSISQLINFYKNKNPRYFFSNFDFLIQDYQSNITYNQDFLYSTHKSKKNHFELNICKNCHKKSKCLQIVPSGLSNQLFKINLSLEKQENCNIYNIISGYP